MAKEKFVIDPFDELEAAEIAVAQQQSALEDAHEYLKEARDYVRAYQWLVGGGGRDRPMFEDFDTAVDELQFNYDFDYETAQGIVRATEMYEEDD